MGELAVHQRTSAEEPPQERVGGTTEPTTDGGGVALCRLLAVATLTPGQAGLLALDLADALEELRRNEQCPGRIDDRSATVSAAGALSLAPAHSGAPTESNPPVQGAEQWRVAAAASASLIHRLIVNTRRSGARRRAESAILADHIDGAGSDVTDLTERVRAAITEILGAGDEQPICRTRRELAALVAAIKGHQPPPDRDPFVIKHEDPVLPVPLVVPRAAVLAPPGWRPSSRRAWHRKRMFRPRKAVLIGLVVLLLGALGWWAVPRAWSELERGWAAILTPNEPSRQLTPVSPPEQQQSGSREVTAGPAKSGVNPRAVKRPAPKQAPPITKVTIERTEGGCTAGKPCPVRVDVHLRSAGTPRQVSWSLQVVDRCSGKVVTRQGVSMTAQAGWRQVYGISRPDLPDGTALAIMAVTEAPARAASAPLLVSSGGAHC